MRLGRILLVLLIQLLALLAPVALGLAGLISAAAAGLTSTLVWFVVGIPLSYAAADLLPRKAVQHTGQRECAAQILFTQNL